MSAPAVPEEWLRLRAAAKRACDERLVVHQVVRREAVEFGPEGHAEDCAGCALRAAVEAVGGELKRGAS